MRASTKDGGESSSYCAYSSDHNAGDGRCEDGGGFYREVRMARKKSSNKDQVGGSMHKNDGRTAEACSGSVVERISLSNRFGGLGMKWKQRSRRMDGGRENENKENENTVNLSSAGSSRTLGKTVAFVAKRK
uniref:Uncharacterized protein n=1 Tax=Brassica oleracea TaxID=3712 RepID=A0A3P6DDC8_BRAOL|nr:unnamed protein product [Brassica oleracea]